MTTIITPIVGAHFRPPAKQLLTVMPIGTELLLVPEPENPYDENAIKVMVSFTNTYPISKWAQLDEALEGTGFTGHQLIAQERAEGPLHLGYIPKSGSKTCQGGPGNAEVIEALSDDQGDWLTFNAQLGSAPEGYPTAIIKIEED